MSVVSIVKSEAPKLSSRVFIAPDIPEKYLNNAVLSISESKADPDVVIAVLDTSLLNSCKAGDCITVGFPIRKRILPQEYRKLGIICDGGYLEATIKVQLQLAQLKYRYRHFGAFEDALMNI